MIITVCDWKLAIAKLILPTFSVAFAFFIVVINIIIVYLVPNLFFDSFSNKS
jgi:hypothetical protein